MDHPTDGDEALVSFHKKRGELIEANKQRGHRLRELFSSDKVLN
jgi:hypothetical protein